MSADLSAAAIGLAYLFAGAGVLSAVSMVPDGALATLGAIGLAYVAGLAATMIVAIALVCVGMSVQALTFALVSLVIGLGGLGVGLRRGAWHLPQGAWRLRRPGQARMSTSAIVPSLRTWPAERWLVAIIGVALASFVVLGYRAAATMPLTGWDAWSIWARKATVLFDYGSLPTGFFTAHAYAFMHPDYPLLVPMLSSIWFRVVGAPNTQSLHIQFWLLYVASLAAAGYVATRVTRPVIWAPLIGLVAISPAVSGQLTTLYADVPMGLMLMIGVLLLGLWISERQGCQLALATLFLAAAASTKNEGLASVACALAVAFVVTLTRPKPCGRRADARALLAATAALAVAIAPWRLWLAVHHIGGDMPIGKGLDPSYLAGRTGRISPTVTALYAQITDQSAWSYILPLAIGVIVACLALRVARRCAAFYGLTGVAIFGATVWAYMINPNPIGWYLTTSADRTVDGMMFVSIAALLHLTGALLTRPAATSPPGPPDDVREQRPLVGSRSGGARRAQRPVQSGPSSGASTL